MRIESRVVGAGMEKKHVHRASFSWRWTEKSDENTKENLPQVGIPNRPF